MDTKSNESEERRTGEKEHDKDSYIGSGVVCQTERMYLVFIFTSSLYRTVHPKQIKIIQVADSVYRKKLFRLIVVKLQHTEPTTQHPSCNEQINSQHTLTRNVVSPHINPRLALNPHHNHRKYQHSYATLTRPETRGQLKIGTCNRFQRMKISPLGGAAHRK